MEERERKIALPGGKALGGTLTIPAAPNGVVVFAHGTGNSRLSPRNRAVASGLNDAGGRPC